MAKKVIKTTKDEKDLEVNMEDTEDVETSDIEPEDKVQETKEEVQEVEVQEAEIKEASISEGVKVKIRVNKNVESYIGDRFYRLEAGQDYNVPKNVKEILKGAGYLEAI